LLNSIAQNLLSRSGEYFGSFSFFTPQEVSLLSSAKGIGYFIQLLHNNPSVLDNDLNRNLFSFKEALSKRITFMEFGVLNPGGNPRRNF